MAENDEDMKVGLVVVGFHPRSLEGGFIGADGGRNGVRLCV